MPDLVNLYNSGAIPLVYESGNVIPNMVNERPRNLYMYEGNISIPR